MNKKYLTALLAAFTSPCLMAQNVLPYDWKITTENGSVDSVNLLVSWEHQGHFWHDGNCSLVSDFYVDQPSDEYILTSKLQCFINSIRINDSIVGKDITTQFWANRDACTTIPLPNGILKEGKNHIEILCKDLSYTGGISHNICKITSKNNSEEECIHLSIEPENHIFTDKTPRITLKYKTSTDATIRFRVESDFHETMLDSIFHVSKNDSLISIDLNNVTPTAGFYQCMAVMQGSGYNGDVQWIGVRPENIACENHKCDNFDAYWAATKAELQTIAPNFKMHKIDSLCNDIRDGYIVEMQSLGNLTVRGYYFVPRKGKKHIAILHVPGYGYGFEDLSIFTKSPADVAEFALCVRGHGISADVFNPGFGIPGIWGNKLYDKDSMAYRSIYMDCVRAVEFLHSRKEIDPHKIAVTGGSQGGGLTLATAALCPDMISACAYFDPFPCDIRHQIKTRTICRTEIQLYLEYYNNPISFEEAMDLQEFVDTRSFAESIKCPTCFATSLFDDDCPPHGGFVAYNSIKAPKEYVVYPYDSHLSESNYSKYLINWILDTFNKKKSKK